ncbi:hypothetical protein [Kitasatospora terrestris]|uniref:Lipopolysaccharide assembly protein A domain-containing protein n=1 Tax=Kitasatospora terrestris TaxID=258051 RepID=A0ABP9ENC8_9ACTN
MLVLGLLLLAATGAFTGLVIAQNLSGGPDYTVTLFDNELGSVNTLGAFLAGIGVTLLLGLAIAMILGGTTRRLRRRYATGAPAPAPAPAPAAPPQPQPYAEPPTAAGGRVDRPVNPGPPPETLTTADEPGTPSARPGGGPAAWVKNRLHG